MARAAKSAIEIDKYDTAGTTAAVELLLLIMLPTFKL